MQQILETGGHTLLHHLSQQQDGRKHLCDGHADISISCNFKLFVVCLSVMLSLLLDKKVNALFLKLVTGGGRLNSSFRARSICPPYVGLGVMVTHQRLPPIQVISFFFKLVIIGLKMLSFRETRTSWALKKKKSVWTVTKELKREDSKASDRGDLTFQCNFTSYFIVW